jgi:hypothetical protein
MGAVQSRITVIGKIIVLCAVCALCNAALSYLLNTLLKVPLYADTIFTVAMCFTAGLLAGIFTGAALSPLAFFLVCKYLLGLPYEISWVRNIFTICVLAEVALVCFFHAKIRGREAVFLQKPSLSSFTGVATHLLVLVALDCIVVSVCGGTIDFILGKLSAPLAYSPEDTFELGLLHNNIPLFATAVLARIPINIVDRFFFFFFWYGLSLVFIKWLTAEKTIKWGFTNKEK